MKIKYFTLLSILITFIMSVQAFAATPLVWAVNDEHEVYSPVLQKIIEDHIPQFIIESFNEHNGQVVIEATKTDSMGIAGYTNGHPNEIGWYSWDPKATYVTVTPSYGMQHMQSTTLHEFGHVFDMITGATNDVTVIQMINAELPGYNNLEVNTGYMVSGCKNAHELFAQVFAAIVSNNDGTVLHSEDIINTCPNTAKYIKTLLAQYTNDDKHKYRKDNK